MGKLRFGKKRRTQAHRQKRKGRRQKLRFRKRNLLLHIRKLRRLKESDRKKIGGWVLQIILVSMAAFMIVFYFGLRVSNAGDSMKPELRNGDIVLVNRLVYNASAPKRGDVIAFRPYGNENTHYYVKRIVGLPGETVQIKDGQVYINGKVQKEDIYVSEIEKPGVASEEIQLKSDEYFVLGDHASGSDDSRMADIGNVKRSEIEGKVWFNITPGASFGKVN